MLLPPGQPHGVGAGEGASGVSASAQHAPQAQAEAQVSQQSVPIVTIPDAIFEAAGRGSSTASHLAAASDGREGGSRWAAEQ